MAFEYFLKLDGIEGESTRKGYEKQIEAEVFEWGEIAPSSGGGGGSGKVEMEDFQVVMRSSKASPALFLACASGKHLKFAVLTVLHAGKAGAIAMRWTLSDVQVSSYQIGGAVAEDALPQEHVALAFTKIELEYFPQTAKGGTGTPIKAGWDRKTNKPT
jgi:type VI secretion system secreted protein Hcp